MTKPRFFIFDAHFQTRDPYGTTQKNRQAFFLSMLVYCFLFTCRLPMLMYSISVFLRVPQAARVLSTGKWARECSKCSTKRPETTRGHNKRNSTRQGSSRYNFFQFGQENSQLIGYGGDAAQIRHPWRRQAIDGRRWTAPDHLSRLTLLGFCVCVCFSMLVYCYISVLRIKMLRIVLGA